MIVIKIFSQSTPLGSGSSSKYCHLNETKQRKILSDNSRIAHMSGKLKKAFFSNCNKVYMGISAYLADIDTHKSVRFWHRPISDVLTMHGQIIQYPGAAVF